MKAVIITPNYPSRKTPQNGSFVHQLLLEWEKIGLEPLVINPLSFPNFIRNLTKKKSDIAQNLFTVRRPLYLTFGSRYIFGFNLKIFKSLSFSKAIDTRNINFKEVAFLYGQFLLTSGYAISKLKDKCNIPGFVDIGESTLLASFDEKELKFAKSIIEKMDGFICVSLKLREDLLALGAEKEDILFAPNGVNLEKFKILNKFECRKKIGLNEGDFVIAFVGYFIERKGPNRIIDALRLLNLNIKVLFIGEGPINVDSEFTFFQGKVVNSELPKYLNCADIFVLPTLAEGNCNAINEAKACAIPVISSKIPEISEQVSENEGILVDPSSIEEIASGIEFFYSNPDKKEEFRKKLIQNRKNLSIQSRAQKIDNWIKNKLK
jgi:teichuronic acid biosynthesis glycosyltransferase TuaC